MLEVKVTANTEAEPKTNLPHECPHWSFGSTNWFDGTTEYLVSFPRTDVVYVAELQGCCRDKITCDKEEDPWDPATCTGRCKNYNERDSRGLSHMGDSPYHLQTSIRLDRDPPPLSFLPSIVPFFVGAGAIEPPIFLDVPVLDYQATVRASASRTQQALEAGAESWPSKIVRARLQQQVA